MHNTYHIAELDVLISSHSTSLEAIGVNFKICPIYIEYIFLK